jgi:hypothetical protein
MCASLFLVSSLEKASASFMLKLQKENLPLHTYMAFYGHTVWCLALLINAPEVEV